MRKRILIIRFSSIGDIVLTTPVVRCLKHQLDADVHVLTKEVFAPVLHANPHVDKIITLRSDLNEVIGELRAYQYDWIADLHHNARSLRVKMALRRPGVAFPKLNIEKWLLTNLRINRLPAVHVVDRYFETVRALGVTNDGMGLDMYIDVAAQVDVKTVSNGILAPGAYVAMAIGAGLATKNLEDGQWRDLAERIGIPVAFLGGQGDTSRGDRLASHVERAINFAGRLTLAQSASVISQGAVLVTPDTGLMHIGAALRKPVISVWGNTVPEFGMTPYYPAGMEAMHEMWEVPGLKCRPCSKIGYAQCPKGHFHCIRMLDLDGIAEAVRKRIQSLTSM